MTKETLRQHYKSLRASLDTEAVADQSLAIANQVLQLPIWEYTNYHIFLPIENKIEVDTSYLLSVLQGKDKSVILSKSNFDWAVGSMGSPSYIFSQISNPSAARAMSYVSVAEHMANKKPPLAT